MKINNEDLKFQQIEAAFRYIVDNKEIYKNNDLHDIYEFGVYKGASLEKITNYINWLFREEFGKYPLVYGFDSFAGLPKEDDRLAVFEKFTEGSYDASKDSATPVLDIYKRIFYSGLHIIHKPFSELGWSDKYTTMRPALLIHIDCDIYTSTKHALNWLIVNNLIGNNTLIAYDEFSIEDCDASEERAHIEIMTYFKHIYSYEEVWHSNYFDKTNNKKVRQSVFRIIKNNDR